MGIHLKVLINSTKNRKKQNKTKQQQQTNASLRLNGNPKVSSTQNWTNI